MPTVGLSMIVKNEAHTLRACLESVRGVVSQVVIGDTGSTDNTVELARELGATVVSIPWENDFAKARNAALEPITTDWVLSLDADEELDQEARQAIPELVMRSDAAGYIADVRVYVPGKIGRAGDQVGKPNDGRHPRAEEAPGYFTYEKCRLFRRRPDIYFTGRVHEQVEGRIQALGSGLRSASFCIHNFGALTGQERLGEKIGFYRDLLRLRVQEEPNDFRGWTYLGRMEYDSFNNREQALRYFERALELNPGCVQAWLYSAMICIDLGRCNEALVFLQPARTDDGSTTLREQLFGDAFYGLSQWEEARAAYQRALDLAGDDPQLESKLGFTEVNLGMKPIGLARLRRAAAAQPQTIEIHDRLMKAYLLAAMLPEAAEAAEQFSTVVAYPKIFLRAASIRAQLKQWEASEKLLARGLELFPEAPELRAAYSEMRSRLNPG